MARETKHPGVQAGLAAVELAFDVGPAPIGREGAARLVRERIARDGLRCERLDLSDETVRRGTLFDMSGARVLFPKGKPYDRCYVALIDPDVTARWTHPAYWAFVPADGSDVVVIQPTERPEHASGQVRLRPVPLS